MNKTTNHFQPSPLWKMVRNLPMNSAARAQYDNLIKQNANYFLVVMIESVILTTIIMAIVLIKILE